MMPPLEVTVTEGTLLGGLVRHDQTVAGHRTGIEPVLLAAAVAARPGERVLEGGTGSGAALMCLATRCPGISGVGIERDDGLASLARRNVAANGLHGLQIVTADLTAPDLFGPDLFGPDLFGPGARFDHAMANPPWHHSAATPSGDVRQDAARRAPDGLFAAWIAALARVLRHQGSLTLVVAAARLAECFTALAQADCGSVAVLPLWPRAGVAAKLLLLRARKSGRGPSRLLPGLVLHGAGGYTPEAERVLRGGLALDWNG